MNTELSKLILFFLVSHGILCLFNGFHFHAPSKLLRNEKRNFFNMAYDTIVKVDSNHEAKCSLRHDKGFSLNNYMKLPVEQYVCIKMPLDASLERTSGSADMFNLTVPPVTFFNLEVSPMISCKVYQTSDSVVIESKEVILRGSPFVVGLNGCYKIKIKTVFKWLDTAHQKSIYSNSDIYVEVDPPAPFKYFGKPDYIFFNF